MIQLYIGDGKGKTTAAVGQAVRAWGWRKRILFAQFLKCGETGEIHALESLEGIVIFRPQMRHKGFIWNMDEKSLADTLEDLGRGFEKLCEIVKSGHWAMIVLDEILDAIQCGFISEEGLLDLANSLPEGTELILTGRSASQKLREAAQYITLLSKEKHPYDLGILARKGIEY